MTKHFYQQHAIPDCKGPISISCQGCGREQTNLERALFDPELILALRTAGANLTGSLIQDGQQPLEERVMEHDGYGHKLETLAALLDPEQKGMYPTS